MIYAITIGAVLMAIAVYAVLVYRRFPALVQESLTGYLFIEKRTHAYTKIAVGVLLFLVWAAMLWRLVQEQRYALVCLLFAASWVGLLVYAYIQGVRSRHCDKCGGEINIFRQAEWAGYPAVIYLHVCHRCKAYRKEMMMAMGE